MNVRLIVPSNPAINLSKQDAALTIQATASLSLTNPTAIFRITGTRLHNQTGHSGSYVLTRLTCLLAPTIRYMMSLLTCSFFTLPSYNRNR